MISSIHSDLIWPLVGTTKYTKQKMGIILVENTWITKINVLLTLMLLCYMSIWCEIDYNHPFTIANDEPYFLDKKEI